MVVLKMLVAENTVEKPASPDIIRIDDAAISELNPLSRVIHPEEIEIEGRLNDAENDGHGVRLPVVRVQLSPDPVQAVQGAIGT